MTDNEVTAAFLDAAPGDGEGGLHARRIVERKHFKLIYERNPGDVGINPEAGRVVCAGLVEEFGAENIRGDHYRQRGSAPDFPVQLRNDEVVSSLDVSETLGQLPVVSVDYVFAERAQFDDAKKWLDEHRTGIIRPQEEADGG